MFEQRKLGRRSVLLGVAAMFVPTGATASIVEPILPPPPQPAAPKTAPVRAALPHDIVDYFAGSWSGAGSFAKTGKPLSSEMQFHQIVEGDALLLNAAERPPNDFKYSGIISVDAATGELLLLLTSNHGAGARLMRSSGWKGAKLAFEADPKLHARFGRERITFIKEGRDAFSAVYEFSVDEGRSWTIGDTQRFSRVPAVG